MVMYVDVLQHDLLEDASGKAVEGYGRVAFPYLSIDFPSTIPSELHFKMHS